jgi:hypothetical protein
MCGGGYAEHRCEWNVVNLPLSPQSERQVHTLYSSLIMESSSNTHSTSPDILKMDVSLPQSMQASYELNDLPSGVYIDGVYKPHLSLPYSEWPESEKLISKIYRWLRENKDVFAEYSVKYNLKSIDPHTATESEYKAYRFEFGKYRRLYKKLLYGRAKRLERKNLLMNVPKEQQVKIKEPACTPVRPPMYMSVERLDEIDRIFASIQIR